MDTGTVGAQARKIVASVFFIGYLPASGTVASALTVAALWLAQTKGVLPQTPTGTLWYWLAVIAVTGASLFFSSHSRELFGAEDSRKIVIDEVAGQLFTFLFVPLSMYTLIAGFFLFRFFDIVKPFPVYRLEELEDGVGVTMDDVGAGILANVTLLLILLVYHAVKAQL